MSLSGILGRSYSSPRNLIYCNNTRATLQKKLRLSISCKIYYLGIKSNSHLYEEWPLPEC